MRSRGTHLAFRVQILVYRYECWEECREMQTFAVVVRNEQTGETVTVAVESAADADAQVLALVQLFYTRGWRSATALQPLYGTAAEKAKEA